MKSNLYLELKDRVDNMNLKDSMLRLLNVEAPPLPEEQVIHIEDIIGAPVASKHNQHAIVMIVGKTGEGKSRTALFAGYKVALYLAKQLGGHWKDYFNSENIAVMTTEEVIRVMKANSPKKVIILDDIGAAWNSRDWNSKGNKILNRIIMTFRNKNNLLILTLPDSFILDKVPRNLLHFHIEMFKQEFDQGFAIYKLFRVLRRYRTGKTYFVHPRLNGVKFVAGAVDDSEIPQELIDEYDADTELKNHWKDEWNKTTSFIKTRNLIAHNPPFYNFDVDMDSNTGNIHIKSGKEEMHCLKKPIGKPGSGLSLKRLTRECTELRALIISLDNAHTSEIYKD